MDVEEYTENVSNELHQEKVKKQIPIIVKKRVPVLQYKKPSYEQSLQYDNDDFVRYLQNLDLHVVYKDDTTGNSKTTNQATLDNSNDTMAVACPDDGLHQTSESTLMISTSVPSVENTWYLILMIPKKVKTYNDKMFKEIELADYENIELYFSDVYAVIRKPALTILATRLDIVYHFTVGSQGLKELKSHLQNTNLKVIMVNEPEDLNRKISHVQSSTYRRRKDVDSDEDSEYSDNYENDEYSSDNKSKEGNIKLNVDKVNNVNTVSSKYITSNDIEPPKLINWNPKDMEVMDVFLYKYMWLLLFRMDVYVKYRTLKDKLSDTKPYKVELKLPYWKNDKTELEKKIHGKKKTMSLRPNYVFPPWNSISKGIGKNDSNKKIQKAPNARNPLHTGIGYTGIDAFQWDQSTSLGPATPGMTGINELSTEYLKDLGKVLLRIQRTAESAHNTRCEDIEPRRRVFSKSFAAAFGFGLHSNEADEFRYEHCTISCGNAILGHLDKSNSTDIGMDGDLQTYRIWTKGDTYRCLQNTKTSSLVGNMVVDDDTIKKLVDRLHGPYDHDLTWTFLLYTRKCCQDKCATEKRADLMADNDPLFREVHRFINMYAKFFSDEEQIPDVLLHSNFIIDEKVDYKGLQTSLVEGATKMMYYSSFVDQILRLISMFPTFRTKRHVLHLVTFAAFECNGQDLFQALTEFWIVNNSTREEYLSCDMYDRNVLHQSIPENAVEKPKCLEDIADAINDNLFAMLNFDAYLLQSDELPETNVFGDTVISSKGARYQRSSSLMAWNQTKSTLDDHIKKSQRTKPPAVYVRRFSKEITREIEKVLVEVQDSPVSAKHLDRLYNALHKLFSKRGQIQAQTMIHLSAMVGLIPIQYALYWHTSSTITVDSSKIIKQYGEIVPVVPPTQKTNLSTSKKPTSSKRKSTNSTPTGATKVVKGQIFQKLLDDLHSVGRKIPAVILENILSIIYRMQQSNPSKGDSGKALTDDNKTKAVNRGQRTVSTPPPYIHDHIDSEPPYTSKLKRDILYAREANSIQPLPKGDYFTDTIADSAYSMNPRKAWQLCPEAKYAKFAIESDVITIDKKKPVVKKNLITEVIKVDDSSSSQEDKPCTQSNNEDSSVVHSDSQSIFSGSQNITTREKTQQYNNTGKNADIGDGSNYALVQNVYRLNIPSSTKKAKTMQSLFFPTIGKVVFQFYDRMKDEWIDVEKYFPNLWTASIDNDDRIVVQHYFDRDMTIPFHNLGSSLIKISNEKNNKENAVNHDDSDDASEMSEENDDESENSIVVNDRPVTAKKPRTSSPK